MRRIYANKLAFATGLIVILMSILFALWRVSGGEHDADGSIDRNHDLPFRGRCEVQAAFLSMLV